MKLISRISRGTDIEAIRRDLIFEDNFQFDFACLFVSSFAAGAIKEIIDLARDTIKVPYFLGCSSSGIVGVESEVEGEPACSLILGKFDKSKINPFFIDQSQLDSMEGAADWYEFFEVYPNENPKFIVFADPFLIDINQFLTGMNRYYEKCPIIGGLASGAAQSKENVLFLNDQNFNQGIVGLAITGDVKMETVVSQGCRPIGESYIVTKAEGNIIYELAGQRFFEVLRNVLQSATQRERTLAEEAIFLGIVMDEYKHDLKRGDFLIRMLMGIDEKIGAGAIADFINPGQTVQFHVRDAISASEDLNELLQMQNEKHRISKPQGALIFTCNGRGENLFQVKNHDIDIFHKYMGKIPVTGFFCAGEIGPVGGKNFIHGFTSSIALFYDDQ